MLKATRDTENKLTMEAKSLIESLKESIADCGKFHEIIRTNREEDIKRRELTREFQNDIFTLLDKTLSLSSDLSSRSKKYLHDVSDYVKEDCEQEEK